MGSCGVALGWGAQHREGSQEYCKDCVWGQEGVRLTAGGRWRRSLCCTPETNSILMCTVIKHFYIKFLNKEKA